MILSHISLRVTLAYLDILYISYVNRMKAQNNNLSWFNQTEQENFQLLYSSLKRGNLVDWNKTYGLFYSSNVYVKNEVSINNISDQQHSISISSIPYLNSNLADFDLWNNNFNSISIFGIIKKSTDNVKNIIISLNCIVSFINKRDIKNNSEVNLSYPKGFG